MTSKYYGLTQEEWDAASIVREKRNFEFNATVALGWFLCAEETYRGALILATQSAKARNDIAKDFVKKIETRGIEGNKSRFSTIKEMRQHVDSRQINVANFLLARSIEMLLKAIIIEKYPTEFFNDNKFEMQFHKNGHNLFWLAQKAEFPISEKQEFLLNELTYKSMDGLYIQPKSVSEVRARRIHTESKSIKLNGGLFKEAALLYDEVLNIYRNLRQNNGKTQRENLFRMAKVLR